MKLEGLFVEVNLQIRLPQVEEQWLITYRLKPKKKMKFLR